MIDVLCSGTFNILHAEHIRLLEFAARWGKVTVGINDDVYLQEKYGEYAVPLVNRAYVLRSNRFVDDVVVFSEPDPSKLIRKLRPRYYVRGPDYRGAVLSEQHALDEVGARVLIRPGQRHQGSTDLVQSLPASAFAEMLIDF